MPTPRLGRLRRPRHTRAAPSRARRAAPPLCGATTENGPWSRISRSIVNVAALPTHPGSVACGGPDAPRRSLAGALARRRSAATENKQILVRSRTDGPRVVRFDRVGESRDHEVARPYFEIAARAEPAVSFAMLGLSVQIQTLHAYHCADAAAGRRSRCCSAWRWRQPVTLASRAGSATARAQAPAPRELTFDVFEKSIAELQRALSSGAISSRELVEQYLARIRAYDAGGPRRTR